MAKEAAPTAAPTAPAKAAMGAGEGGKAIVLFSDGTGNSSAKLFKTNVWRMYEAVDLGPPAEGKRKQIAFYDNGVGTSALRPIAMLAGIFGFGLKRNVLEIYRYACRNYTPAAGQEPGEEARDGGDELYGFGFSRGAFTMRLLISLIADQGLVHGETDREIKRKSKDAYRAYRAGFLPQKWSHPTRFWRWARAGLSNRWRRWRGRDLYNQRRNYHPIIRFVGVWDTVAAYGGPIIEITRGIDNWLYALSMPTYLLHPRVRCARHALAIDDERDAFHPLLWDEVAEAGLRDEHPRSQRPWLHHEKWEDARLQQVWFTGMHADVGGGYPDESLSFVSFLWLKNEVEKAGLRTLQVITDRHRALANSAGPVHDSRSGPGAYYRYQPRNIGAWLHPADSDSIITDPELTDKGGKPKGLIEIAHVHESVLARISAGTDLYAPFTLPAEIRIVPPQPGDETAAQADSESDEAPPPAEEQPSRPLLSGELHKRLEDKIVGAARAQAMTAVWDQVWIRRCLYFITLALTLALVGMPWWIGYAPDPLFFADGRTWISGLIRMLAVVTPDFLDPLIDTMADNSFYFLALVALIGAMLWVSSARERRLRQLARGIWAETMTIGGPPPAPAAQGLVYRLRTSKSYRRPMRWLKWHILPALAALVLLLLLVWLLIGSYVQVRLPGLERSNVLCRFEPRPDGEADPPVDIQRFDFTPSATCVPTGLTVQERQRYIVEFEVVEPWRNGDVTTDPAGLDAGDLGFTGYLGVPLRRVLTANYLQPLIEIRTPAGYNWLGGVHIQPLTLNQQGDNATSWRGEFTASRDGTLAIFVNEAVWPSRPDYFYSHGEYGNRGTACVTIRRAERAAAIAPLGAPGTACAAADARADAVQERREEEQRRRAEQAAELKRRQMAVEAPQSRPRR